MKIIGFTGFSQESAIGGVILNIAAVLAKEGKKVILIDTDMAEHSLDSLFSDRRVKKIKNDPAAADSSEEIICKTDIQNLFIVLSDAESFNTPELQGPEKLDALCKKFAKTYDYVFVDIPAMNTYDGTEEMKVCNGLILVIKSNTMSYKSAKKAKMELELSGCPILGAVLLQVT